MRLAWLALCSLALVSAASCSDDVPACYEGEYLACSCGDAEGFQRCESGAYAACVCDGTVPGLMTTASVGGGGAGGQGGEGGAPLLAYLAPCDEDEQCETGLCYPFNAKGPHCSHACDNDEDCEAPSPGCSGMGICKVP